MLDSFITNLPSNYMKLLHNLPENYNKVMNYARKLDYKPNSNYVYDGNVIFHAYWYGELTEHHFISIKTCFLTNIKHSLNSSKRKIILWLENNKENHWNSKCSQFAELRQFDVKNEQSDTFLKDYVYNPIALCRRANYIRCLLLYKYGGCWFDLDILFIKSFDPLFVNFGDQICLYSWENQQYPNNAIFFSLKPFDVRLETAMKFIIKRNMGWGFQQAKLTYDLPLDFLILPCTWFDPEWINKTYFSGKFEEFFCKTTKIYTIDNFHPGIFCYHWHNNWHKQIDQTSAMKQLEEDIDVKFQ